MIVIEFTYFFHELWREVSVLSVVTSTGTQSIKIHLNVGTGHFCQVAWFTAEKTVLFDFKCMKSAFISGTINKSYIPIFLL